MKIFTRLILSTLLVLLASSVAFSQLDIGRIYRFSSVTGGTYTPLTGATVVASVSGSQDDVASAAITIPNMNFGVSVTLGTTPVVVNQMYLNTNGWIGLSPSTGGTTTPSGYSILNTATTNMAALAPFNRDMGYPSPFTDPTSDISYLISGTDVTVQFKNLHPYNGSGIADATYNYQAIIHTATGVIEYIYGPCSIATVGTYSGQIGLRGASTAYPANVNVRATSTYTLSSPVGFTPWDATISGTSAAGIVGFSTFEPFLPTSGFKVIYTPTTPTTASSMPATSSAATAITATGATLNWTAASPAPSAGYEARYKKISDPNSSYVTVTTAAAVLTKAITGLTAGTAYVFEVRANAASGFSEWSNGRQFATVDACTAAPAGLSSNIITPVVDGSVARNVTWTNNVLFTLGYNVQYKLSTDVAWTSFAGNPVAPGTGTATLTAGLSGLLPNKSYSFRVQGICAAGTSLFQTAVTFSTTDFCTGPPAGFASVVGVNASIERILNWTNNAAAINGYNIEYKENALSTWTAFPGNPLAAGTITATLTGLTPGVLYAARIQSKCAAGTSLFTTTPITFTPTDFCAGPPAGVAANTSLITDGGTQRNIVWTANASATVGYSIRYRVTGTTTWTVFGSAIAPAATNQILTGLTPSTNYDVQVASICAAGTSQFGPVTPVTFFTTPFLNFEVTKTTGTAYTSIMTTGNTYTSLSSADDGLTNTTPIGFSFVYQGTTFTSFKACTNGWMTLDAVNTTSTAYVNSIGANSSSQRAILAPLWDDLVILSNTLTSKDVCMRYQLTGTSPRQTLTVEWAQMEKYQYAGPNLNFQVKLYENTNEIEYVYGNMSSFDGTKDVAFTYSMGLTSTSANTTLGNGEVMSQQNSNTKVFSATAQNNLNLPPACYTSYLFQPGTYTAGTANPAPANEACSSAIPVTVLSGTPTEYCQIFQPGATIDATAPAATQGNADDDVWFSFSPANTGTVTINVKPAGGYDPVIQLFSGTCGALTAINSRNLNTNPTTATINSAATTVVEETMVQAAMIGGQTYYFRVYHAGVGNHGGSFDNGSSFATAFTAAQVAETGFAASVFFQEDPPVNDNCATSELIVPTSTCTPLARKTVAGTASSQAACGGTPDDDVWFHFVAPSGGEVVTVDVQGLSGFNPHIELFDAGSTPNCATMTTVAGSCINATGLAGLETYSSSTLTAGNTYYVRVYHSAVGSGTGNFTICIKAVCATPTAGAISAIAQTSANVSWTGTGNFIVEYGLAGFTPGTGATAGAGGTILTGAPITIATSGTAQTISGLTGLTAYNVYIRKVCSATSFSANTAVLPFTTLDCTPPTFTSSVTGGCGNDGIVKLNFSSLGNATSLTFDDPTASPSTLTAPGLVSFGPYTTSPTPAITVIHNVSATCNLVSAPQTFLSLGTGNVNVASLPYTDTGLTTCGKGNDITSTNATVCGSANYYTGEDMVFKFTPPTSAVYVMTMTSTSTYSGLMLYAGCPLTTCVVNSQSSTGSKTMSAPLTAGVEYFLVVDAWSTPVCHPSFDMKIEEAPMPPGCATMVSPTSGATGVVPPSVLTWTAPTTGGVPTGYKVYHGATNPPSTTSIGTIAGTSATITGLAYNTQYWWYVVPTNSGGDATGCIPTAAAMFTYTTAGPPPPPGNDNIVNAVALINGVGGCTSSVSGTTESATNPGALVQCAGLANGGDDDVWYSFVATNTTHTITLSTFGVGLVDRVHQVFSSSNNLPTGALTQVICSDPESSTVTTYTIGNTYFVRVHSYDVTGFTTFKICLTSPAPPPLNDDPCSAQTLVLNGPFVGLNTSSATVGTPETSSNLATVHGASALNNTVFYKYTPTYTSAFKVTISSPATSVQVQSTWCTILTEAGNCPSGTLNFTQIPFVPGTSLGSVSGSATAGAALSYTTPVLTTGTEYIFLIDGVSGSFGDFTFKIEEISPNCATLLTPANAATGVALTAPLTWSAPTGPSVTSYKVYFGIGTPTLVATVPAGTTTYTPTGLLAGTTYSWYVVASNVTGDAVGCTTPRTYTTAAVVPSKIFLSNVDPVTGLMESVLPFITTLGEQFPLSDPYSVAPWDADFVHVNSGATVTTTAAIRDQDLGGPNSIIDWIFIELRQGMPGSTMVMFTRSALLQADGDIVEASDGTTPVTFANATAGAYFVAIRHRNHLGFRTENQITLPASPVLANLDFTSTTNPIALNGLVNLITVGGVRKMYGGDANRDRSVDAFDNLEWINPSQNGATDIYTTGTADYNLDGSIDALDNALWSLYPGIVDELD
jgi:hypothetical protein